MSSSVVSSSLAWTDDWALLTRMSIPPKACTVASTAASTCSRTPTSQAIATAVPPRSAISAATASHFERVRPDERDRRALLRERQCGPPADALTRSRHERHPAVQPTRHCSSSDPELCSARSGASLLHTSWTWSLARSSDIPPMDAQK